MSKSIEEMTHDYMIASIQAGCPVGVDELIALAEEVKTKGNKVDKNIERTKKEDARRRY